MTGAIYLYPKVFPSENPYIKDLESSLSSRYEIVNKSTTQNGVLDLYKYIFKADIFFFNWIESLASKRYGKFQIVVFVFFLFLAKCLRKKIIWTLHNQYAHDQKSNRWVDFMFNLMFRHSDMIMTHSQSGVDFAGEKYPSFVNKVKYFVHPVKEMVNVLPRDEYEYDFFIWGTIWPYKGIIEFLRFLQEQKDEKHLKVLIVGRCIDDKIKAELDPYISDNIVHLHEFYEIEEIAKFAGKAKFTLFTYRPESVLSSGSLMDSIRMGSVIIGPNVGAFKDLSSYSFVKTYNSFPEILLIQRNYTFIKDIVNNEIEAFCNDNSWSLFGERLSTALSDTFAKS